MIFHPPIGRFTTLTLITAALFRRGGRLLELMPSILGLFPYLEPLCYWLRDLGTSRYKAATILGLLFTFIPIATVLFLLFWFILLG